MMRSRPSSARFWGLELTVNSPSSNRGGRRPLKSRPEGARADGGRLPDYVLSVSGTGSVLLAQIINDKTSPLHLWSGSSVRMMCGRFGREKKKLYELRIYTQKMMPTNIASGAHIFQKSYEFVVRRACKPPWKPFSEHLQPEVNASNFICKQENKSSLLLLKRRLTMWLVLPR